MHASGRNLKLLREKAGLTQQDVADCLGIRVRAWQYIESGERPVPSKHVLRLSELFSVSSDIILGIKELPHESEVELRERRMRSQIYKIAKDLPRWNDESEIDEFVNWVVENSQDDMFFQGFEDTLAFRQVKLPIYVRDMRILYEMERRGK